MLSWRLLLATGKSRYADLIERTLYNVVATSTAPDGKSFFYSNTLHRRTPGEVSNPDEQSKRADSSSRAPWFDVACCPNNLARTLASLELYIVSTSAGAVQIHQYVAGDISLHLDSGERIMMRVETEYPQDGQIRVKIVDAPPYSWTLALRIPSGMGSVTATVAGGDPMPVASGYFNVARVFAIGDEIVLRIPMEPRFTSADPRIDGTRGCVALERSPFVYCVEPTDLPAGITVDDFVVDADIAPQTSNGGLRIIGRVQQPEGEAWPYRAPQTPSAQLATVVARPYYLWGLRGPTTMRVWMRLV